MKNIQRKGEKLNNKGMTLIELMVAVAILSVAIVPLMYAFVSSMRYNAKGRELQQTTVLAHTIMEKCKGLTAEEIDERMLNHTFLDSYTVSADGTKVPMTNASTLWGLGTEGEHTYFIGGVHLENQTYDVQVTIANHAREDLYNGTNNVYSEMLYTESMNKYNDAVFTVNTLSGFTGDAERYSVAGLDFEAYNAALEMIHDGIKADALNYATITEEVNIPYTDIETIAGNDLKLYRYITVNALSDGSGHDVVNVSYTYTFTLEGGTFSYTYNPPSGGTAITLSCDLGTDEIPLFSPTFMIYDNAATSSNGAKLDNIYFFYYPAYNGGLTEYPISEDIISINNNTGRTINVHMVKQKNPVYADVDLITMEGLYSPDISVSGDVNFYHNYDQNLGNNSKLLAFPSITGVTPMSTLYYKKNEKLMYNVEITIYPANSYNGSYIISGAQPIITMDGTMLDW